MRDWLRLVREPHRGERSSVVPLIQQQSQAAKTMTRRRWKRTRLARCGKRSVPLWQQRQQQQQQSECEVAATRCRGGVEPQCRPPPCGPALPASWVWPGRIPSWCKSLAEDGTNLGVGFGSWLKSRRARVCGCLSFKSKWWKGGIKVWCYRVDGESYRYVLD